MTNLPPGSDPILHHAEALFRAALINIREGKEPISLTFASKNEATNFRHSIQRWRAAQGPNNPYYEVTIRLTKEEPWILTFAPRFSDALAAQIAQIASQISDGTPPETYDVDALLKQMQGDPDA